MPAVLICNQIIFFPLHATDDNLDRSLYISLLEMVTLSSGGEDKLHTQNKPITNAITSCFEARFHIYGERKMREAKRS